MKEDMSERSNKKRIFGLLVDWGLVIQKDRIVLSVKRNFYHLHCLKVCVFGNIISKRKTYIWIDQW